GGNLTYELLRLAYTTTPGLVADKLKAVLELTWASMMEQTCRGVVFGYDEAQNLSDHGAKYQFPLSLMLEVFQSIQRKGIPFMLVFTGLPTLLARLIDARTYSERMFHVLILDRLDEDDSRTAITKPIEDAKCPVKFSGPGI